MIRKNNAIFELHKYLFIKIIEIANQNFITKKQKMKNLVLLLLPIILFVYKGASQISFYQGELNTEFVRNDNFKTFGFPINAVCQFSITDLTMKYKFDEKDFSFGDILGVKGGISILGTSNKYSESKLKYNAMVNFGYFIGAFVGYKYNEHKAFLKYTQEIGYSIRMSTEFGRYITNVVSVSGLLANIYYLELGFGYPAKKLALSKTVLEEKDKLFRAAFRYYDVNEEDLFYGFTFERFNCNEKEKITSFNLTFGFNF